MWVGGMGFFFFSPFFFLFWDEGFDYFVGLETKGVPTSSLLSLTVFLFFFFLPHWFDGDLHTQCGDSSFWEPGLGFVPLWSWSHGTSGLAQAWRPVWGRWVWILACGVGAALSSPQQPLYRPRFAMQNNLSQVLFWLATLFSNFTKCSTNIHYGESIRTVE